MINGWNSIDSVLDFIRLLDSKLAAFQAQALRMVKAWTRIQKGQMKVNGHKGLVNVYMVYLEKIQPKVKPWDWLNTPSDYKPITLDSTVIGCCVCQWKSWSPVTKTKQRNGNMK